MRRRPEGSGQRTLEDAAGLFGDVPDFAHLLDASEMSPVTLTKRFAASVPPIAISVCDPS